MSIRDLFVERFGEDNASRVEEASIGHVNDDTSGSLHKNDKWGSDPFRYHLLNCISRECFGRWAKFHGFSFEVEEVREWCLAHADLDQHDGDVPDWIGRVAGAYEGWMTNDEPDESIFPVAVLAASIEAVALASALATGMLNHHGPVEEGPPSEGTE